MTPLLSIRIRYRSCFWIDLVTELGNILTTGQKLVILGSQFFLEECLEFGLNLCDPGIVAEVSLLKRIRMVVVQQPGTFEIADVRVSDRSQAPVFFTASTPLPFTEGGRAGDDCRTVGGIFTATQITTEIQPFDAGRDFELAKTQQCRHQVFRINGSIEGATFCVLGSIEPEQHRHPQRFIPRFLFADLSVGMQHVAVIGGEDDDRVVIDTGFFQCRQQIANAVIQRTAVGIVSCQLFFRGGLLVFGYIGTQLDFLGLIHALIFRRCRVIRIVRRSV